jgi:hypothetical protein
MNPSRKENEIFFEVIPLSETNFTGRVVFVVYLNIPLNRPRPDL